MKLPNLLCSILLCATATAAQLSVTDYGAGPNDALDDTAAIKAAIAASNGGDTVYIPAGEYLISGILEPRAWTTFAGESRDTVTLKYEYAGNWTEVMIKAGYRNNVTITSMTIDGDNDPNMGRGIDISNSTGMVVKDVRIQNLGYVGSGFNGQGIIGNQHTDNAVISDNIFLNMAPGGQWGSAVFLSNSSDGNLIENNTVTNTGRGGILLKGGTSAGSYSENNIIRNNVITGVGQYWGDGSSWGDVALGIEIHTNCNNTLIERNTMDHWLSIDQSSRCAIRNNTVTQASGRIKLIGLEHAGGSDNVFSGNAVEDGAQIGISISKNPAKDRTLWARNSIIKANTWGVQVQGDAGGASQHYFYKNEFRETRKDAGGALYAGQGHGFRFNQDASDITLDQNVIADNENGGIQTSLGIESLSFVNNTITDNGGPAVIEDPTSASNLEWSSNAVSGNATNTQLASRGFSNLKPSAGFTHNETIYAGVETTFMSTATDLDGAVAEYLWDLGAGLPSTVANPSVTYDQPGEYTVYQVVWDDEGRGHIAEKTIQVILPPLVIDGQAGSGSVTLRWPKAATGYALESSTSLEAETWDPASITPVENEDDLEVGWTVGDTDTFFRLSIN